MGAGILSNTFTGSSYEPLTIIASAPINEDMAQILEDLTTHLAILRVAFNKLDTIDYYATGSLNAYEIVTKMNASYVRIDANNIFTNFGTLTGITSAISSHLNQTNYSYKHALSTIQGLTTTYSITPSSFVTSTSRTMADEINNIRYQIYKIIGKTTWVSSPTKSLNALNTAFNNFDPHNIQVNIRLVTSNTSLSSTDSIVYVDTSGGALTVTLPSLADTRLQGMTYTIIMPTTSTSKLTLARASSTDTIDNSSTISLYANRSVMVIGDCVQKKWWLVGDYGN